jgi:ABC-type Fe3+ transport system permease subunit
MTRLLRTLTASAALVLVGLAAPATASTTDVETVSFQETTVTSSLASPTGSALSSTLTVGLAAGIVTGAAGSAYLVRRSRSRAGLTARHDREVVTL